MLLSRLAENLYWAGRYLERAEATARLVRVHSELFLDLPRSLNVGWAPLLAVTGTSDAFAALEEEAEPGSAAPTEETRVVRFLTTSSDHRGSVLASLTAARSNLRSVRALIPRSGWEVANRLHMWAAERADQAVPRRSRLEWLEGIQRRCQTIDGLLGSTMSHDQAYKFLIVGRQIERADMTTRVLDVQATTLLEHPRARDVAYNDVVWMGVLKSVSAMQMYRRVARAGVSGPRALAFLLHDAQFPRSVQHCLTALDDALKTLPNADATLVAAATVRQSLAGADASALDGPAALHTLMDTLQTDLSEVHAAAHATWFAPPISSPRQAQVA